MKRLERLRTLAARLVGRTRAQPSISISGSGPVLAVWLLVASAVSAPYVLASLDPPPGRVFVGTFHWIDDYQNYLSFAQQAEDGRFLFDNKLSLEARQPALVNIEWWIVGRLSRALGGRPFLAYRILALALLAGLLTAADRELRRGGLPSSARFSALLLVGLGGGLGGLLFELTPRPIWRCPDLAVGFFPFLQALANPHWLAAAWLLLESLSAFSRGGSSGSRMRGILFGTALGLTRPYDLVLLGMVEISAVLISARPGEWVRRLLPLIGLLPVVAYDYWVFFQTPLFATYSTTEYRHPPPVDLLPALGPVLVLALVGARRGAGAQAAPLRLRLWLWAGIATLVGATALVTFSIQLYVGAGLPLLMLGAWTLGQLPRRVPPLVALAFSASFLVALRVVLSGDPHWFVAAERRQAALALRAVCRPGQVVFAPEDIGLDVLSLTACRPFVSHHWAPGHELRSGVVSSFYRASSFAERRRILEEFGIDFLLLPGDLAPDAASWLGVGSGAEKLAVVDEGPRAISIYRTPRRAP